MPLAALIANNNLNVEARAPTTGGVFAPPRVAAPTTVTDAGTGRFTITVDGTDTIRRARVTDGGTATFTFTIVCTDRRNEDEELLLLIDHDPVWSFLLELDE